MGLLENVRSYLISAGVVSTGWSCYVGYAPDDADKVIVIQPTGGFPQDTLGGENMLPTFQVAIRAGKLDYATADTKWNQVWKAISTGSISGVRAMIPTRTGPLAFVDEKNRHNLTMDFRATIDAP